MANTIQAAKLIVALDIDETLLMAHTVDSLQTRLTRIKAER
jgi:orotidine-5'-phosphate decarboxylase